MSVLAVTTLLTNDSAVATLVGDRISPEWRTQSGRLPAITVTDIATVFDNELINQSALAASSVQVDIYAQTYADMREIEAAVIAAVNQFSGVIAGISVDRISIEARRDLGEIDGDKAIRRASLDFNCWFQR